MRHDAASGSLCAADGRALADTAVSRNTAEIAFIALFPGFFLYHSGAGLGLTSLVLGGYRSVIAAGLAIPLALLYVRRLPGLRARHVDAAFFGFVAYLLIVVALNYLLGADGDVLRGHFLSAVQWTAVFMIFRLGEFRSRWFVRTAWVCLLGMSAITFVFSQDGFFYLIQLGHSDSDSLASYQQLALSYTMVYFVLLITEKRLTVRLLLFLLCLGTLWMHGARSEFAAVVVVTGVLELVIAQKRAAIVAAAAALALVLYATHDVIIPALPDNRMVQLFDLAENTSWQSRNELLAQALATIEYSPLVGDYGSYARTALYGGAGDYAHNILSAWVDLGLPGFIYLSLLIGLPLLRLASLAPGQHRDVPFLMAGTLVLFNGLLLFVAKEFTYLPVAAALGAYASFEVSVSGARSGRRLTSRMGSR